VESDDHGKRHWLREPITKPNGNSYSDTVTKHIPDINSNSNAYTSDTHAHTNASGDTHSDTSNHTHSTTNHTYSNAGYTYSHAAGSNPDTNATADSNPNPDSKSNTCRPGPQPLD
jgi:hypothetical protein